MPSVNYFTFSQPVNQLAQSPKLLQDVDAKNPLFKFESDFFDNLHAISPTELARSVPYISIFSLDLNGEVIADLNTSFFFDAIDFSKMNEGRRYGDIPVMSLKSVEIKTSQPPGSGYLYFTDVVINLKLHAPEYLTSAQVISLTLPGMNHMIEYGWNSPSKYLNDFKERLLFQIATYDLKYDETGQIDLIVRGKALNDFFNNTLLGDEGQLIASNLVSNRGADGLARNKERLQQYEAYLREVVEKKDVIDHAIAEATADDFTPIENIARGVISQRMRERRIALESEKQKEGNFLLHDVINILFKPTFEAMVDIWPAIKEFRIIYGDVNEKAAGGTIPKSLAEFPINAEKLNSLIKKEIEKGSYSLTCKQLMNILMNDFIENDQLWKKKKEDNSDFNKPDIVLNFSNRYLPDTKEQVIEMTLHDVNFDIPVTTSSTPPGKSSKAESEKPFIDAGLLPLRLGHANSFVKKANLTQVRDQAMKTAMIVRMFENRSISPRSSKAPSLQNLSIPTNPLRLPIQGTIDVLGHTKWKPFRSFYLDAGSFLVSGVYKIMSVSHKLSAGEFSTVLEIFPN